MSFDERKRPPIKNLDDLRNYLYFQIGTMTMEEIDSMLHLVLKLERRTECFKEIIT